MAISFISRKKKCFVPELESLYLAIYFLQFENALASQLRWHREVILGNPPQKRELQTQTIKNKQKNTRKTTDKENKFLPDKFLGSLESHSLWSSRLITGFHGDSIPYIRCR